MASQPERKPSQATAIKETLISITIAFALAFVFRMFVIEPFVIPTGSMAPTLMGAHMRLRSPATGYTWAVGPWTYLDDQLTASPVQRNIEVTDPMTGPFSTGGRAVDAHEAVQRGVGVYRTAVSRRAGDRILVFKYLEPLFSPTRFDCVVFKSPETPQTNYIKRLIGLPGEEVALVDGDVFFRRPGPGDPTDPRADRWSLDGWTIARKTEDQHVQRAVWMDVFDSTYAPMNEPRDRDRNRPIRSPWVGSTTGWNTSGRTYRYDGSGPTALEWDEARWPILDAYPYNDLSPGRDLQRSFFPVSDLRLRLGVEPTAGSVDVSAVIDARGHQFRADIAGTDVTLRMARLGADASAPSLWSTLATGRLARPIEAGRVTIVEFWHVDQSLEVWVDGTRVAGGPRAAAYDWSPAERIRNATGRSIADLLAEEARSPTRNIFADGSRYRHARPRFEFSGGPVVLHRVALQRDLHYQADVYNDRNIRRDVHSRAATPARGTHPAHVADLGPDQFFTCGDNSPASSDARLWDAPDPWVRDSIDGTIGVVPRRLMIGKAFFVYFPGVHPWGQAFVPDFGRLRFIY